MTSAPDRVLPLPRSYVAAQYLGDLPSLAASIAAAAFVMTRDATVARYLLPVLVIGLLVRLIVPLHTLSTCRLAVDGQRVDMRSGWLHLRWRTVLLKDVDSLEMQQTWAMRLFGLHRVVLRQASDQANDLVIPAATQAQSEMLSRWAVEADEDVQISPRRSGQLEMDTPDAESWFPSEVIFKATTRDMVIASVMYGKSIAIAGGVAAALFGALETLGVTPAPGEVSSAGAVGLALAFAGLLTLGTVGSLVRYWGFELSWHGGDLLITYGLADRRERRVRASAVVGLRVTRTLPEAISGRVRLALITSDSRQGWGGDVVLPSLRRAVVCQIAATEFPGWIPSAGSLLSVASARATRRLASAAGLLLVIGFGSGFIADRIARVDPAGSVACGVAGSALALVLARMAMARVSYSSGGMRILCSTNRFLYETQCMVKVQHVQSLSTLAVKGRVLFWRSSYYSGRPRSLAAFRFELDEISQVAAEITSPGSPVPVQGATA